MKGCRAGGKGAAGTTSLPLHHPPWPQPYHLLFVLLCLTVVNGSLQAPVCNATCASQACSRRVSLTLPLPDVPAQNFGSGLHDPVVDPEEERLLRLWLNSLNPRIQLASLYSKQMSTVS